MYGIYMHLYIFFYNWMDRFECDAYTMKNDWEVVKSLTV